VTTNKAGISRSAVQTACVTRVDIKGTPPPCTLRGASVSYRYARQTHACVSKGQAGSWSLTLPCFKQASIHYVSTSRSMFRRRATHRPRRPIAVAYKRTQTSHSCQSLIICGMLNDVNLHYLTWLATVKMSKRPAKFVCTCVHGRCHRSWCHTYCHGRGDERATWDRCRPTF